MGVFSFENLPYERVLPDSKLFLRLPRFRFRNLESPNTVSVAVFFLFRILTFAATFKVF